MMTIVLQVSAVLMSAHISGQWFLEENMRYGKNKIRKKALCNTTHGYGCLKLRENLPVVLQKLSNKQRIPGQRELTPLGTVDKGSKRVIVLHRTGLVTDSSTNDRESEYGSHIQTFRGHNTSLLSHKPESGPSKSIDIEEDHDNIDKIGYRGRNKSILEQHAKFRTLLRRGNKDRRFLSSAKEKLQEHMKSHKDWELSPTEAKKLFQKYDECQVNRVKALQAEEFPIKAFMAIEGEKVAMECEVCYRPDKDKASQEAKWQVLHHEATTLLEIRHTDKFRLRKDNTLVVRDIDVNDAGQYFCLEKRDYAAIYQLDVFLTDKRRNLEFGSDEPRPEEFLMDRNLRVFTMWAEWGQCNTCDREGHKFRVGQCTVQKIYQDMPVFPRDYPLMVLYPDGVPCHSTALPRHIRKLSEIGQRYSETLVSLCLEKCPTEPPQRTVTDEDGNVVEVLEPGFYSMKDKPKLPSLVKRKVLYEIEKTHLVLKCPGSLDTSLLRWARGERDIDPGSIKRLTRNRVWLDSSNRLHLKPLLITDTAVYK